MNELMSLRDKELFTAWVNEFSVLSDIDKYLSDWYTEKNNYLFKMFNNQLIHNFNYTYEKTDYEYRTEYYKYVQNDWIMNLYRLAEGCFGKNWWWHGCEVGSIQRNIYTVLCNLNDIDVIVGIQDVNPVTLTYNHIKCTIHTKERWVRAIRKVLKFICRLCEEYGTPASSETVANIESEITKIQNAVSQIKTNKTVNATLSLSIHPLDYLTMSDNDSDWSSCMSWEENGCYHAGTVEMMNSPCIVVAYLNSSTPMKRRFWKNEDWEWNNKRWRCLFIVDKNFICGIKEYPYNDPTLMATVVELLRSMAQENLGWEYDMDTQSCKDVIRPDGKSQYFGTGLMYQDIHTHTIPIITWSTNFDTNCPISYNYSGDAYCPCCGEPLTIPELHECPQCAGWVQCDECGEYYPSSDDLEYSNGKYYCENCWEALTAQCEVCGDWEVNTIQVIAETAEFGTYCRDMCHYCFNNYNDYFENKRLIPVPVEERDDDYKDLLCRIFGLDEDIELI